jgi:hypothetical protein
MSRYQMIPAIKDTAKIERQKGSRKFRINAAEQLLANRRDSPRICGRATCQAAYYSQQLGRFHGLRKMILKT